LCFGGFLIVGGKVADVVDARRAFAVGLVGFTGTSLLCALAGSAELLLAARAAQGTAAALLSPAALALLTASTEAGPGRRRAIGMWTAAAAGGGFPALNLTVIVGSLLGSRLIALLSARWTAAGGFALITGGCLVLAFLPDVGVPTGRLLTAFGLMGTGLGLASTASTAAGTDAAPAPHRGVASGLLNATAQIGTALGLALVVPVVAVAPSSTSMRW